jgi:hypothetical protein
MADCKKYNGSTWQHSLRKLDTSTDTITALPAVLYPNASSITVGIKGNTTQSTTPTPDNPIMPEGTGERTGNLWNEDYTGIGGTIKYVPIFVGDGTFTLSTDTPDFSRNAPLFLLSGNVTSGVSTPINGVYNDISRTTDSLNGYITIAFRRQSESSDPTTHKTMLNSGSTALPYEPYGYKIPISSAGQTTPIYLGEVETTRRIKKLVLDGTENWRLNNRIASVGGKYFNLSIATQERTEFGKMLCSHYTVGNPYDRLTACCVAVNYSQGIDIRVNNPSTDGNITDFKAYLAAQYAAGTPVTIWYMLATPETAVVNEPLMKIGDYADSLTTSIPCTAGENTLDVQTTVAPSEVTATFEGWHPVANVHEKSRNLFDGVIYEGFYNDNGQLVIDTSNGCHTNLIKANTQITYTVSNLWTTSFNFAVYEWDINKQWLRRTNRQLPPSDKITFTLNNDCAYFSLQINSSYDYTRLMLNEGSTALPYEPYWT